MNRPANRKGLNTRLYKYSDKSLFMNIDYANVSVVDLSANRTWATGGQNQGRKVGFDDPIESTLRLSTQIVPIELLALIANQTGVGSGADLAIREVLTCETVGTVTLSSTPVAGSLYVYEFDSDLSGTPAATTSTGTTVTIADAAVGDKFVAYYINTNATAQTVTFDNVNTPGAYIIYSDTVWKTEDDTIIAEQLHAYKAMPQKALSMTYQGAGDPISIDITFDLMEDEDGNVITYVRQ